MERYNRIYKDKKSAQMIASDFRKATGKKMDSAFVHWFVNRLRENGQNINEYHYGKETYYASNIRTLIDANYYRLYPIYLQEKEQKKLEKNKTKDTGYDPDKWIEGDTSPRFYTPTDESIDRCIKSVINETVNKRFN